VHTFPDNPSTSETRETAPMPLCWRCAGELSRFDFAGGGPATAFPRAGSAYPPDIASPEMGREMVENAGILCEPGNGNIGVCLEKIGPYGPRGRFSSAPEAGRVRRLSGFCRIVKLTNCRPQKSIVA
jgi:hypothetical protein